PGSNTGTFTVTRAGSAAAALTVNYTVSGTATAAADYSTLPGTVTIPAGAATATITVTPIDDAIAETDETVIATLAAGTGYSVGSPASATVTISDNETPVVSIVATDAIAAEPTTDKGTFTVSRIGSTLSSLTVFYSVSGTATAGSDYTALS